jgi:hypothetical protein
MAITPAHSNDLTHSLMTHEWEVARPLPKTATPNLGALVLACLLARPKHLWLPHRFNAFMWRRSLLHSLRRLTAPGVLCLLSLRMNGFQAILRRTRFTRCKIEREGRDNWSSRQAARTMQRQSPYDKQRKRCKMMDGVRPRDHKLPRPSLGRRKKTREPYVERIRSRPRSLSDSN